MSLDAANEQNDPTLKIDTREKLETELRVLVLSLIQRKDEFFKDAPWAMILFEEVEWAGGTLPLKDHLVSLLKSQNPHISGTELFERIHRETTPLVALASRRMLESISHRINLYRTHREKLLIHGLVQEQVAQYLEQLEDEEALQVYRRLIGMEKDSISRWDVALTAAAFGVCFLGGRIVALPTAFFLAIMRTTDHLSWDHSLFGGTVFGLNSLSQYEISHATPLPMKILGELSAIGASIIGCSAPKLASFRFGPRIRAKSAFAKNAGIPPQENFGSQVHGKSSLGKTHRYQCGPGSDGLNFNPCGNSGTTTRHTLPVYQSAFSSYGPDCIGNRVCLCF